MLKRKVQQIDHDALYRKKLIANKRIIMRHDGRPTGPTGNRRRNM